MSQTVSIRLDEEVISSLDQLSGITERSRSWLMSHAIEQYIEHEAWQIKAIERTLSKVQDGTAKYASHEAVSDWLNSWGSDEERTAPTCK